MEVLKFCFVSLIVFTALAIVDIWRYGNERLQNDRKKRWDAQRIL